jgi:PadR family transcriptional regulator PadR
MLILKLLEEKDMYGYQMIDTLSRKSDNTFNLKAGTLYPILHGLESAELVSSYDDGAGGGRIRKYYHLSHKGKKLLADKQSEWAAFTGGGIKHALRPQPPLLDDEQQQHRRQKNGFTEKDGDATPVP